MINPQNSPWYRPNRAGRIQDRQLYFRWHAIQQHLQTQGHVYREVANQLIIDELFMIAKNSKKMRLLSHLDWAYYEPRLLADAMDQGQIELFYEQQLKDPNSDPNQWRDHDKEMQLKTHYAARRGRASKI